MKKALSTAVVCALLAGCGGGGAGGPAAIPTTPPAPAGPQYLTALGDSITWGGNASDPSKDYASLLAADLNAPLTNLGIRGETDVPEPNSVLSGVAANGAPYAAMGGVLSDEVPNIPLNTTVVTLYIGTNDIWMAQATVKPDFSNEGVLGQVGAMFAQDIVNTIAGIRARVPLARIVVATDINVADKPGLAGLNFEPYTTYRTNITAMVNQMNAAIASTGVAVADLHCDPALYDPANYAADFIHPNDSGHARIAADFLAALQHGGRAAACPYDGVTSG